MKAPPWPRWPLALALTAALIVKVALLVWLWHAFFSAPQAKKMRMPTSAVEQHLLSPTRPSPKPPAQAQP